jgi:DNA-directed RNA polymerase specialized sigma24 family protein
VGNGDPSFAAYFDEHYPHIFRLLAVALRDEARAGDAAELALIGACTRWSRGSRRAPPSAAQLYTDAARHALRHVAAVSPSGAWTSEPDTLARAIEELPVRERLALLLHHRAGFTREQLGRTLRCSPARAASTLREAYRRIGIVDDDDDDIPEVEFDDP